MEPGGRPGEEAIRVKGWFAAHRFLILRRISQLSILALFVVGGAFGIKSALFSSELTVSSPSSLLAPEPPRGSLCAPPPRSLVGRI